MIRYLLDTNVISEPARPEPDTGILVKLEQHGHEAAIASISWHELRYGLERLPAGNRRTYMADYLNQVIQPVFPVLPYEGVAAQWHARERARLETEGRTPAFADGQIAAIARTRDLILVTRNTKDFTKFEGLHLENWFSPDQ